LGLLVAVLRYQESVAPTIDPGAAAGAAGRLAAGRYPLLDLDAAARTVVEGIPAAVAALSTPGDRGGPEGAGDRGVPQGAGDRGVPEGAGDRGVPEGAGVVPDTLAAAGPPLAAASELERMAVVDAWLEDPLTVDPLTGFWVGVAAGPVLEEARAVITGPSREQWTGRACPACGGLPQVSVIAPESGEFMGGSPRSLICGRCAGWWTFPRAMCAWCGEDDPRKVAPFVPESGAARIDACETCSVYVKTFDLRQAGGVAVVPLVDDVATLTLDLWAREQGLHRPVVSLAGI
jgi:FdhE protein